MEPSLSDLSDLSLLEYKRWQGIVGPNAHPVAQALIGYANKCASPFVHDPDLESIHPWGGAGERLLIIARASSSRQAAGVVSGYVRQKCPPAAWNLSRLLDLLDLGACLRTKPFRSLPYADWAHVDAATDWAALPDPRTPFPGEAVPTSPLVIAPPPAEVLLLPSKAFRVVTVRIAKELFQAESGFVMTDRTFRHWLGDERLVTMGKQGEPKEIDRDALVEKAREYRARREAGQFVRRYAEAIPH